MELPNSVGTDGALSPTFRPMKVDDIETICEIEQEAFPTPWTPGAFQNELTNNHFAHYLVMEVEGTIAGYAGMWIIMDEAHITNIAVRTGFRGLKLGERLLTELRRKAGKGGARRMTLEVRVTNRVAQNLYEKLGFRSVGVRKGYYTDNNEDALIMWADIPEERWKTS
jgi:[ribosomal protein S18]-alanine N-acetyltransferase